MIDQFIEKVASTLSDSTLRSARFNVKRSSPEISNSHRNLLMFLKTETKGRNEGLI